MSIKQNIQNQSSHKMCIYNTVHYGFVQKPQISNASIMHWKYHLQHIYLNIYCSLRGVDERKL